MREERRTNSQPPPSACHNQTVKDASGSYRTYEEGGFVKSEQGCTVCHTDLKRVPANGHHGGGKR